MEKLIEAVQAYGRAVRIHEASLYGSSYNVRDEYRVDLDKKEAELLDLIQQSQPTPPAVTQEVVEKVRYNLQDIIEHSVAPFTGDKWRNYTREVAQETLQLLPEGSRT